MFINWRARELSLKIVYYGPALSGKTTNLEYIYTRVNPKRRGELISLKTYEDRTLYFDFLQLELGKVGGLTPKIHLYTVPGQTYYEASRKLVLRGADGIVFVADSAPEQLGANLKSWQDMKSHLTQFNMPLNSLPLVIQFNKRDLPNAMWIPSLQEFLDISDSTSFEAIATEGYGVFDTFKAIVHRVVNRAQREVV